MWIKTLPILFLVGVFIFNYIWAKSCKPVRDNPVVFTDDGNPIWFIAAALCMVGFAISLLFVGLA